jgi:hypothetical protein
MISSENRAEPRQKSRVTGLDTSLNDGYIDRNNWIDVESWQASASGCSDLLDFSLKRNAQALVSING